MFFRTRCAHGATLSIYLIFSMGTDTITQFYVCKGNSNIEKYSQQNLHFYKGMKRFSSMCLCRAVGGFNFPIRLQKHCFVLNLSGSDHHFLMDFSLWSYNRKKKKSRKDPSIAEISAKRVIKSDTHNQKFLTDNWILI